MKKKIFLLITGIALLIILLSKSIYQKLELNQNIPKIDKEKDEKKPVEIGKNELLKNVWIIKANKDKRKVKVFWEGEEQTLFSKYPLSKEISSAIGDITIEENQITKISIQNKIIQDKVLMANNTYIDLEKYGKLKWETDYKIYRVYGELAEEKANGILVGYSNTNFVINSQGEICAALIQQPMKAETIRVLLKTNGHKDIYHSKVQLTADCNFTIYNGKKQKTYKKGQKITITKIAKVITSGRAKIVPEKEDGKITLLSISRNNISPSYRGIIEVTNEENGFLIVNELPLEEYLYSVVPSEMPTSYGKEALKVQAICARSYAYRQLLDNKCSQYGAHVDDSVSYQVYNNVPENDASILAVKDTFGIVPKYNEEVILAYYFSTSCGYTASAHQVWLSDKEIPYLKGKTQFINEKLAKQKLDLSKDAEFTKFLNNTNKTYDSDFPWYRWKVKLSYKNITKVINATLQTRYQANPNLIQVLQKNGKYTSTPIDTIGEVKQLRILNREACGIITSIEIIGSENTIKVMSEYNIRTLLAPLYNQVIRQDNTTITNLSMLPSSFFIINKSSSKKEILITGGGYGHGVGMSQNGVKSLADAGKNYKEILKHYYNGITLEYIY